jgi:hypothetical protein
MAYNFLACARDQAFLLPPDLRDRLPSDHLAWFVLAVQQHQSAGGAESRLTGTEMRLSRPPCHQTSATAAPLHIAEN